MNERLISATRLIPKRNELWSTRWGRSSGSRGGIFLLILGGRRVSRTFLVGACGRSPGRPDGGGGEERAKGRMLMIMRHGAFVSGLLLVLGKGFLLAFSFGEADATCVRSPFNRHKTLAEWALVRIKQARVMRLMMPTRPVAKTWFSFLRDGARVVEEMKVRRAFFFSTVSSCSRCCI